MPFAFSTLGCPDAAFGDVLALARAHGAAGIELRIADGQPASIRSTADQRRGIRAQAADAAVQIIAACSYLRVCEPGDDDDFVARATQHLRLAHDLGAAALRMFPGRSGADREGRERAVRRLSALVPLGRRTRVRMLLETHGARPRACDLAPILAGLDDRVPGNDVGVIWDVLHPWRAGERPATTASILGSRVAYVQIKDARRGADGALTAVGDGDVPLDEVVAAMRGRNVWWSLEWEKAWNPQLPDLEVGLAGAARWFREHAAAGAPDSSPAG